MKVLVVEDEASLGRIIRRGLLHYRLVVEVVTTGKEALERIRTYAYDAIILDLYLGDMHGRELLERMRRERITTPVLVLSSEADTDTKVTVLQWCDDYVTKPCLIKELHARLRALTRRSVEPHSEILSIGPLEVDTVKYTAHLHGKLIPFRNKEFALLEYLMRHQDEVLSRETILSHVWDVHTDPFTNTVDTHIRLLRKKLEDAQHIFIHTVPRRGYRFSV